MRTLFITVLSLLASMVLRGQGIPPAPPPVFTTYLNLSDSQAAELPGLVNALRLQSPACLAVTLDLIDTPSVGGGPPTAIMPPTGPGVAAAALASIRE
jgi:hypothetical protein